MKAKLLLSVLLLGFVRRGAGGAGGGHGSQGAGTSTPNSIVISPDPAAVTLEATQVFTAVVYDSNNNVLNVTPSWEVTGGIGTITNAGLFTATAEGTGIVRAVYGGLSDEAAVTVKGNFFPHEIGYSWTYSKSGTDETTVITVTGTSTSIITGETITIFSNTRKNPSGSIIESQEAYYKVIDSAVYYYGYTYGATTAIYLPPMTALSFPLSIGKTWTYSNSAATYTFTVMAFEDVITPAGTFKCYKIETSLALYYGTFTWHMWYGNNAGFVKSLDPYGGAEILESKNF